VGDATGPGFCLSFFEGGRPLSAEGRCGLANQLGILVIEVLLGELVGSYAHFWCMEGKEGRAYPAG
jgi:hypothetical protein